MWKLLPWICAAAISGLALKYFPIPYLWIFSTWAAVLFSTAWLDKPRRALWFNGACLLIGLAIFESYLWTVRPEPVRRHRVVEGTYANVPNKELGWVPEAGTVVSQREFYRGELVYGATYTIGSNGLRISSPSGDHDGSPAAACILFFGDSFTFGQGLDDHQTLPFQVGIKSNHRYRTFNFGVMGYGAHQMLSALQHGLVDDAMSCDRARVSDVLYQAIPDHVRRSAGRLGWNARGPRYRLTDDGSVRLDGRFEDEHGSRKTLAQLVGNQLARSMIYKAILEGRYLYRYDRAAIDLYVGIVGQAREFVRSRYSCAQFHVLLWDEDDIDNRAVREGLRRIGIDVHLMSDILPHYRADGLNQAYRLHRADAHPNALANELIADYVVREILPRPGPCDALQPS